MNLQYRICTVSVHKGKPDRS